MTRTLRKLALAALLAALALSTDAFAGRGGGGRGGYGGGQRGEMGGGQMSRSPSNESRPPSGNQGEYGNRNPSGNNASGAANRNQPNHPNAAAGAAGAGYANKNQPNHSNAGAAAAGAANRNQPNHPNAAAGAAGAGYANRNSSTLPNGGAGAAGAAAGAGYANRNNSTLPNGGVGAAGAAVGAGYANRNNTNLPYGGAAAAVGAGYWNGNHSGAWGMGGYGMGYGGVGAWGTGSPMYGWGYSNYSNPYSGGYSGTGGGQQVIGNAPQQDASASNYAQPISTTAATPDPAVADQATSAFAQSRDAFKAGDYVQAQQLDQQALAQTPNDTTLHEFLALTLFAQGKYDQAAAPLYAVLSVGPGWNWTTLSGMYPDVDSYVGHLRKLEAYIRANPGSAQARFVLAYHYLCEGHDENAVKQLKEVVRLQPADTLSAQLVAQYQPAGAAQPPPSPADVDAAPGVEGKLTGRWSAAPASGAKVALAVQDDGKFTWAVSGPGKPATTITGSSTLADGLLTLNADGGQNGALVGKVAWQDTDHFTFRLVGAPPQDPGLKFAR